MQELEVRCVKQLKENQKLPQYEPFQDPVLNNFCRKTMFHQAQGAVMDEMAKIDQHMQKVRENLMKKQIIAQKSERIRQLRQQKKIGKQMQIETTLKKQMEEKKMLEEVKKYCKGI